MTETLEQRIMRHEGFSAIPKMDAKGMWEIGYGHDLSEEESENYPSPIDEAQGQTLLENDLNEIALNAHQRFPWLEYLDDIRSGVILEMCYQMGIEGVAGFSNMIAAMRVKDYSRAATCMVLSDWHSETPDRCDELARIMSSGEIPLTPAA